MWSGGAIRSSPRSAGGRSAGGRTGTGPNMPRICFTTCADEGFLEGLKGLIKSIRRFYAPAEADVVVFYDQPDDFVAAFCRDHAAELHYFGEIDGWRQPLLQTDRYLGDATHFYHDSFEVLPGIPHHTERES